VAETDSPIAATAGDPPVLTRYATAELVLYRFPAACIPSRGWARCYETCNGSGLVFHAFLARVSSKVTRPSQRRDFPWT
jgi:hypothetical protein